MSTVRSCFYCVSFSTRERELTDYCSHFRVELKLHDTQFMMFYLQGNPNSCPYFQYNEYSM